MKSILHPCLRIAAALGWSAVAWLAVNAAAYAADLAPGSELGPSELQVTGSNGQVARIAQDGERNQALIRQQGAQHSGQVTQNGSGNEASADQAGIADQFVLSQAGSGNRIALTQTGNGNQAAVDQVGAGHLAAIDQLGNANSVNVRQNPGSPDPLLRQQGNGLATTVIQY
jgi:minor curlin subunit